MLFPTVVVVTSTSPNIPEFSTIMAAIFVSTSGGVRAFSEESDISGNIRLRIDMGGNPASTFTKTG